MKRLFIVFCFLTSFIYSIQNEIDEIIFKYRNEYLEYSYYNNQDYGGIIKKIYVGDTLDLGNYPYDGLKITVRKNGKVSYVKTINELSKLEKNQTKDPVDLQIQKNNDNLKNEEKPLLKTKKYLELELPKEKYRVLLQKIKRLETKTKAYYKNEPHSLENEIKRQEYMFNLGYVTEIQLLTYNVVYFEDEISYGMEKQILTQNIVYYEKELLKENEIFLLSEEIKDYIENYVEKEYIEKIN